MQLNTRRECQFQQMMIGRSQTVLQAARTAASACRVEMAAANHPARIVVIWTDHSDTPPADASRGATADLCDVFLPDPVDVITESKVSIVAPLFRFGPRSPCPLMHDSDRPSLLSEPRPLDARALSSLCRGSCRDYGGNCGSAGRQPLSSALRTTRWFGRCVVTCRSNHLALICAWQENMALPEYAHNLVRWASARLRPTCTHVTRAL